MRIFRNLQLKLLALVFAMALWFHVATNQRYDLEILYSINFVNIPHALVMAEASDTQVAVLIRGSGKGLLRLIWGERSWPVDLSRAKVGRQQIRIQPDNVPLYGIKDLEVLGLVDEDTLTITIDSVGQKTVPVRSAVEIETSVGFVRSTDPVLTPDSIVLSGPRSSLARIEEAWTQPDVIENVRDPVERLLSLMPAREFGVMADVKQVRLYQKVEPYLTRAFSSVPVHVRGEISPDEFDIRPGQVLVEVAGPQSAVIQLVAESIGVVCEPSSISATDRFVRASATVPSPMQVLKLSPDSVTVERHERTRADSGD